MKNKEGEVSSCDLSYQAELNQFNEEYLKYTAQVAASCQDRDLSEKSMVIGTSAIIDTEMDGAHAGKFLSNLQDEINNL